MNDRIFLHNLRLKCRIGVTDEERRTPQEVISDIDLCINLKRAATSDNLNDTVNYREALQRVSQFVSSNEFRLIETLAERLASLALETPSVERVIVRVRKAKYSNEPSIGVEVERSRREV